MTLYVFLRSLLAPPALQLLLVLLGLWCLRRRRPVPGYGLVALALFSLYFLATPLGDGLLARGLERDPPLPSDPAAWGGAQAIVVLGGGRYAAAPEFGGQDMPNYWTASRLRYAAFLYRQSGLPLLVSGGRVAAEAESEAAVMARSLQRDYVVNVRWQEERSRTTWENAQHTRALLGPLGLRRIVLVTQSRHMARARLAFEHAGFEVVPAPVDFARPPAQPWLLRLRCSPAHFMGAAQSLHEYAGLAFYWLRVRLEGS